MSTPTKRVNAPGITLGTWFRKYNTVEPDLNHEDLAWAILAHKPWACTPQLVAHLTKYIKETAMAKKPKPKPKPKPGGQGRVR